MEAKKKHFPFLCTLISQSIESTLLVLLLCWYKRKRREKKVISTQNQPVNQTHKDAASDTRLSNSVVCVCVCVNVIRSLSNKVDSTSGVAQQVHACGVMIMCLVCHLTSVFGLSDCICAYV